MLGFTLDTGALIALDRRSRRVRQFIELAYADGYTLRSPTVVLGEFWRGSTRTKAVGQLIETGIEWIDVTPGLARQAGAALAEVGTQPSLVDALVATLAALHGDLVLTSDPEDFAMLATYYRDLRVARV